ncbi:hypothetical protein ACJZL1_06195 [Wolbachia endosymbiont of Rhagoletis indifferens]|nr:hypothetical protein [Wolbachia endosymbiont (group A) of Bibio marci]
MFIFYHLLTLPRRYELGIAWLEAREDNHFSEWIGGRLALFLSVLV